MEHSNPELLEMHLDYDGGHTLFETVRWSRFVAIVGMVGVGLLVLLLAILGSRFIDRVSRDQLRQIALWSKISSICAFAGYLLALVSAFFGHHRMSTLADESPMAGTVRLGNIIGTLVVIIVGGIINYFLYRFARVAGRGVQSMDALQVNSGFNSLRLYFKITGILLIIFLSFLVLVVLITVISAAGSSPDF